MAVIRILLAAAVIPLAGCGTIVNLTEGQTTAVCCPPPGPTEVYGGVKNDLQHYSDWRSSEMFTPNIIAAAHLADLPLSAVADTVTLPIAISLANAEHEPSDTARED